MARNEFSKATQRAAWKRSGGACEAEGALFGMGRDVRCGADMTRVGVRYDHVNPDANSKDNSLENCCACCPRCHDYKTRHRDMPLIAKTQRQQDRANGIARCPSRIMPGNRNSKFKRRVGGWLELRQP
jgi:hypothetical protein